VLEWREGRAASVTEVFSGYEDDKRALEDWRHRTEVLAREIGRGPEVECPLGGPERISGECTATWTADRLLVVVGAHRGAGGRHRGAISVYTLWAYPPLFPAQESPEPRD
jgi:hypothetical protein